VKFEILNDFEEYFSRSYFIVETHKQIASYISFDYKIGLSFYNPDKIKSF